MEEEDAYAEEEDAYAEDDDMYVGEEDASAWQFSVSMSLTN